MYCPACGSKSTGKIGEQEYYCWECCIEFTVTERGVQQYNIAPDGSLVLLQGAN